MNHEVKNAKRQSSIRRRPSESLVAPVVDRSSSHEGEDLRKTSAYVPENFGYPSAPAKVDSNPLLSDATKILGKASDILMRSSLHDNDGAGSAGGRGVASRLPSAEMEKAVAMQTKATEVDEQRKETRRRRSMLLQEQRGEGGGPATAEPTAPFLAKPAAALPSSHPLTSHPRFIAGDPAAAIVPPSTGEQQQRSNAVADGEQIEREAQRMSAIISAGAHMEVLIEIFAEMRNSIGRLRTNLLAEEAKTSSSGGGMGGSLRESTAFITRLRGKSNAKALSSPSSTLQLAANRKSSDADGAPSLRGSSGSGETASVRRCAWALSLISSALHTSMEALDGVQDRDDFVASARSSTSSARLVERFVEDLNLSRHQLIEIAMLIVSINGSR